MQLFQFNNREKQGVGWLMLIILIMIGINLYVARFWKSPPINYSIINAELAVGKVLNLSLFNPNTVSYDSLLSFGLPRKLASQLINYRTKVGLFSSKQELKKLYAMTDSLYLEIEPFILISESKIKLSEKSNPVSKYSSKPIAKPKSKSYKREEKAISISLNNATEEDLVKLRGIGPTFSSRIIKYRNLLGGFINKNQLKEVYGITDSLYQIIESHIEVHSENVSQLDINNLDAKTLAKHPYIKWYVANALVKYREQHGCFENTTDVKKSDLVNEELYSKIAPYLRVEPCQ